MADKPKPTVCLSASHMVTRVFGTVQIQQSLHTEPCVAVENHCTSQGGHIPRQCPVPAARLHRFEQDWADQKYGLETEVASNAPQVAGYSSGEEEQQEALWKGCMK